MLSVADLPLLALLSLAGATLVCSALGRPWPPRPELWARWLLRLGLGLALAATVTVLARLEPGGALQTTLWQLGPRLPVTLVVDRTGTVVAIMVLVAALVVSFAARERRPLASACLGLAVLGGVGAAFAGDLLSLYIGLQLSSLGGIGLSYARQPRAASSRMVWAAAVDQLVGLLWLAALVAVLHGTSTLELDAIPPGSVGPLLAAPLVLPALARLGGCLLLSAPGAAARAGSNHAVDIADWFTVVAVPTALLVLVRAQALTGGTWPTPWFGTGLDLAALLLGAAAVAVLLWSRQPAREVQALLLAASSLVLVGFGQNSAQGTLLGLGAGLFLQVSVGILPRLTLGVARARPLRPRAGWRWLRTVPIWLGISAALLPLSLAFGVVLLGLGAALGSGLNSGAAPALAYLVAGAALALAAPALPRLLRGAPGWSWPLTLPALCLAGAAAAPGAVLTLAAGTLAAPGTVGQSLLTSPDPLVVQGPSLIWPGGYLALVCLLGWLAVRAMRVAVGAGATAGAPRRSALQVAVAPVPARLLLLIGRAGALQGVGREIRGWYALLVRLADREAGERPVWLWVASTALAAWVLAELTRL